MVSTVASQKEGLGLKSASQPGNFLSGFSLGTSASSHSLKAYI